MFIAMRQIRNVHGEMIVTWTHEEGRHFVTTEYDEGLEPVEYVTSNITNAREAYTTIGHGGHPNLAQYAVLAEEVGRPDLLTAEAAVPGISTLV